MLGGVEARGVERDEAGIAGKGRPGAGGEILQPRADRHDDVGLPGKRIGRRGSDNAHRTGIDRIVVGQRTAPGNRFDDRQAMRCGKCRQGFFGAGIAHAAAGDDQRLFGGLQQLGCGRQPAGVGPRPRHVMQRRLKERHRIIKGDFLNILTQTDEGRPAIGRVEHDGDGLGQGGDDLFGMGDAVPVARHRLERVVDGGRRIAEMLHLLQHRIGTAIGKNVAGQDEQRQPVGMGDTGGGDHIRRARPDRRCGDHDLTPLFRLGKGDRRQRHRLLVLAAPGRQAVLNRFQRFGQAGHIAMAEYAEHAGEQRHALAVDFGELVAQITHDGLRHRQPDRRHDCRFPPDRSNAWWRENSGTSKPY